MTKRDIVINVAAKLGLKQGDVFRVVQETFDCIVDELGKGNKMELRSFGVFKLKVRNSRIGRNPKKPSQIVEIPERVLVSFTSGKELKNKIAMLKPAKFKKTKKD
jgi:nucleoid DNA-binding protein